MNDVQIVAVWGSPGSGKTTTCLKLAQQLAKQGKDVLIIMDDPFCPNLPVVTTQPMDVRSLGELMAAQKISQEDILAACVPLSSRICVLGYVLGDNLYKYASYNRARADELFILTRHIVDVVLVDCDSRVSKSALSAAALDTADKVIRICECTRKSTSALESARGLILENKYNTSKHICCYSIVKPWQDLSVYQTKLLTKHILPFCPELESQMESMQLLEPLSGKPGTKYENSIKSLLQEVFELCPHKRRRPLTTRSQETQASSSPPKPSPFQRFCQIFKSIWSKTTHNG